VGLKFRGSLFASSFRNQISEFHGSNSKLWLHLTVFSFFCADTLGFDKLDRIFVKFYSFLLTFSQATHHFKFWAVQYRYGCDFFTYIHVSRLVFIWFMVLCLLQRSFHSDHRSNYHSTPLVVVRGLADHDVVWVFVRFINLPILHTSHQ
jgi:hypothetical protein